MSNNKVTDYIYKESSEHADEICEKIFPVIRQALMEAYAKGFMKSAKLSTEYNKKIQMQNGADKRIVDKIGV